MSQNAFLAALPDFSTKLEPRDFRQGSALFESGDAISRVYFPDSAIVSLVVPLEDGSVVESAMVGRDGLIGGLAAMDGRISLNSGVVQLGGTGRTCSAEDFKEAVLNNKRALSLVMRHEQVLFAQAQQSAACNASHTLESRFARWMLRANDLCDTSELTFTQEFISEMLGVRRATVSMTAHQLQSAGLINYARGKVRIINRSGLEDVSCECYRVVRGHYLLLWNSAE